MLKSIRPIARGLALGLCLACAAPLHAKDIAFTDWTQQRFSLFGGNSWHQAGQAVSVDSDGAVSLLWTEIPGGPSAATGMSWRWSVEVSVPPTDLSRKGGDDRNLALYAIFMPREAVSKARGRGISALLNAPEARVLMYVWGGNHRRGSSLASPYVGPRGRTIVLRAAGVGSHEETVDLSKDLQRVFGQAGLALVGLAVSADSDDTDTRIRASLRDLRLHGG